MSLINCPECGKEISDKAKQCIHCGYPLDEAEIDNEDMVQEDIDISLQKPYTVCPKCGSLNDAGIFTCQKCFHKYTMGEYNVIVDNLEEDTDIDEPTFNGIYKYVLGGKYEVRCPRCRSDNCSRYTEQKIKPGKISVRYDMNLNPLLPFTLFHKREKVVKKEKVKTKNKFVCNSCGKTFS